MDTELGIIPGPVFHDACKHSKKSYVASYEYLADKFDLYVYKGTHGDAVCIRYGESPESYYSFHNIKYLLISTNGMPIYDLAVKILERKGNFGWKPTSNGDYAFNPRSSDDLYADYVFGKMMKVGFKAKGKTVEISDNPPSIDYQAWCRIYPTTLALLEAAEKAAGVSPAT